MGGGMEQWLWAERTQPPTDASQTTLVVTTCHPVLWRTHILRVCWMNQCGYTADTPTPLPPCESACHIPHFPFPSLARSIHPHLDVFLSEHD